MADFPTAISSWTNKTDGVDYPEADDVNQPNNEVVALQTYLIETASEVTVSGGVLTVTKSRHTVQPETGTSDDINTITGIPDNAELILSVADLGTDTLVFKHGTGNLSLPSSTDLTLTTGAARFYRKGSTVYAQSGGDTTAPASTSKGRFEILGSTVPTTLGAPLGVTAGASTPAESIGHFNFASGAATYIELVGRLIGYNGGGLTINFEVLRTSAAAGETYIFEAAIRRLNTGTENLGSAHTYDYNAVTVTVPAGPPAAGIPMAGVITFTNGADMDSLADNEAAIIYFRRNGGTAADVGRVLTTITIRES